MAKLPSKPAETIQVNGECLQFSHFEVGTPDTDLSQVQATFASCDECEQGSSLIIPGDAGFSSTLPEELSSGVEAISSLQQESSSVKASSSLIVLGASPPVPAPAACPAAPWQGAAPWATNPKDGLYDTYFVSLTVDTIDHVNTDCTPDAGDTTYPTATISGTVTAQGSSCFWTGTADGGFEPLTLGFYDALSSPTGNPGWYLSYGYGFPAFTELGLNPEGPWPDYYICDQGFTVGFIGISNDYTNVSVTPVP